MTILKNLTQKLLMATFTIATMNCGMDQLNAMEPVSDTREDQQYDSIFSVLQSPDINDSIKCNIISQLITEKLSISQEECKTFMSQVNAEGETALLVAVENMRYALISLLLMKKGASVNARSAKYKGQTAVHKAVGARGEDRCIAENCTINTINYKLGVLTAMIEECEADLGAEEYLCKRTPVHIAAQQATLDVVKFVVKSLAKQDKLHLLFKKDTYNRDALAFAQEGMNKQPPQTQDVVDYLATLKEYENDNKMLKTIIDSLQ